MMNQTRLLVPNPALDALEEKWWNEHADLVEAIWAQPLPLRSVVRQHYMQRAKKFFLQGAPQLPVTVLEVGCGSGWACRMIVERGVLNVIGIDISASQIEFAEENAHREGVADLCEYYCENLSDYTVSTDQRVSCVFIQSILHHLTWQEIHAVLSQVAALGRGTKVFIYEPIFPRGKFADNPLTRIPARGISFVLTRLAKAIAKTIVLDQRRHFNRPLRQAVMNMIRESGQRGWVMSPKEVYFPQAELVNTLEKYLTIQNHYLCDNSAVGAAQTAVFYDSPIVTERFRRIVLPLAIRLDRLLYESGITETAADGYVFIGYECVVK